MILFREYRLIRLFRYPVPLRIAVTGTRGKSSVVRLITAVLSGSGLRVLAKTTGTKPLLIFPDGTEKEILRRGRPSILEGKRFLKTAADLGANALVGEMMSIQPETIYVESHQILDPRILVITNVRRDHMESLGRSNLDIARSYAAAIPADGVLILPEEEHFPIFEKEARRRRTRVIRVPQDLLERAVGEREVLPATEFKANLRLALAAADFLKIDLQNAWNSLRSVRSDPGSLSVHLIRKKMSCQKLLAVNAFSVNDPDSTMIVLSRLNLHHPFRDLPWLGILNLRSDRGDRTQQWLEALRAGLFPELKKLVLTGGHAVALRNKLLARFEPSSLQITKIKDPSKMMELVFGMTEGDTAVIGMGNRRGMGGVMCKHWSTVGELYDL